MKDLSTILSDLMTDFPTEKVAYTEKLQTALRLLQYQYPEKAKTQLEQAIALDASLPAAWIGLAFLEWTQIPPDRLQALQGETLLQGVQNLPAALQHKYIGVFLAFVAQQHGKAIQQQVERRWVQRQQTTAWDQQSMLDLLQESDELLQLLMALLLGENPPRRLSAPPLDAIAQNPYGLPCMLVYRTIPLMQVAKQVVEKMETPDARAWAHAGLQSWRHAVLFLVDAQKELLFEVYQQGWRPPNPTAQNVHDLTVPASDTFHQLLHWVGAENSALCQHWTRMRAYPLPKKDVLAFRSRSRFHRTMDQEWQQFKSTYLRTEEMGV